MHTNKNNTSIDTPPTIKHKHICIHIKTSCNTCQYTQTIKSTSANTITKQRTTQYVLIYMNNNNHTQHTQSLIYTITHTYNTYITYAKHIETKQINQNQTKRNKRSTETQHKSNDNNDNFQNTQNKQQKTIATNTIKTAQITRQNHINTHSKTTSKPYTHK